LTGEYEIKTQITDKMISNQPVGCDAFVEYRNGRNEGGWVKVPCNSRARLGVSVSYLDVFGQKRPGRSRPSSEQEPCKPVEYQVFAIHA
jgi:hypothetical protein